MDDRRPEPKPGEYVVIAYRYSFELEGPVAKVTAQKVFFPQRWRKDDLSQAYKDAVLFSGPEAVAKLLAERLASSRAQQQDDDRKAVARHEERKREAIAKAHAALSPAPAPANLEGKA